MHYSIRQRRGPRRVDLSRLLLRHAGASHIASASTVPSRSERRPSRAHPQMEPSKPLRRDASDSAEQAGEVALGRKTECQGDAGKRTQTSRSIAKDTPMRRIFMKRSRLTPVDSLNFLAK